MPNATPLPLPTPDLAPYLERSDYFQPHTWFYAAYGELARREAYLLTSAEARETMFTVLAKTYDLEAATVARLSAIEKIDAPLKDNTLALLLAPRLLLYCHDHGVDGERTVRIYFSPTTDAAALAALRAHLRPYLESGQPERQRIQVLRLQFGDLDFSPLPITVPDLDLATHYNDDLPAAHATIVQRLQQRNDKGLVILHGPPGTGKTSYIRYLAGLTDKPKLFIPPNLAPRIADPEFINLLQDNANSILLIEDAEQLLLKRDGPGGAGASAVSNLLNLSDGLLADCFHIQVVCTFNTELARIDPALLRKGRLIAAYRFEPLVQPKAQALAKSLGQEAAVTEALTLADIYNRDDPNFSDASSSNRIGFNR